MYNFQEKKTKPTQLKIKFYYTVCIKRYRESDKLKVSPAT